MEGKAYQRNYNVLLYAVLGGAALFAALMLTKVIPYLAFGYDTNFLSTKTNQTLDSTLFRIGFYVHITSSCVVIFSGITQFIPWLVNNRPRVHRLLGKVYVVGIMGFAAASGLVLAIYANGGFAAKTGFALQCLVWWFATCMAYLKIIQHNYREHIAWMVRSFAITMAAFSLRTETYVLHTVFHTQPIETYITITWLSWVGNWIVAEIVLAAGFDKYLLRQIKTVRT